MTTENLGEQSPNTEGPIQPDLTPEQQAMNNRMAQVSLHIGQAAIQNAAVMLANTAGGMGIPLAFDLPTENGGKALVYAINGTAEQVERVRLVLDAMLKPLDLGVAPEAPVEGVEGEAAPAETPEA